MSEAENNHGPGTRRCPNCGRYTALECWRLRVDLSGGGVVKASDEYHMEGECPVCWAWVDTRELVRFGAEDGKNRKNGSIGTDERNGNEAMVGMVSVVAAEEEESGFDAVL